MNEKNQNNIFKWTLRFRYIYVLIIGAFLLSAGLAIGLGFEKMSNQKNLDFFIATVSFIIGIIFIVFGFYIKKDIENTITKLNL
tara:strand:+ start:3711 stop:3962 length:252 start_codon:yes stop_codon:yes gene_type:complete